MSRDHIQIDEVNINPIKIYASCSNNWKTKCIDVDQVVRAAKNITFELQLKV